MRRNVSRRSSARCCKRGSRQDWQVCEERRSNEYFFIAVFIYIRYEKKLENLKKNHCKSAKNMYYIIQDAFQEQI